ncbi:hypothetical protein RIF29_14543 [Crotalaria pallida]|uniref:Uncharacterized protein n=1 Tax=Crotalaria pallida TaxID=3830 RepID=A0AAN9FBH3_CROPI
MDESANPEITLHQEKENERGKSRDIECGGGEVGNIPDLERHRVIMDLDKDDGAMMTVKEVSGAAVQG